MINAEIEITNILNSLSDNYFESIAQLKQIGDSCIPVLVRLANGSNIKLQRSAISALGEFDSLALDELIKIAQGNSDPQIRSHATQMVSGIDDIQSMQSLVRLAGDDSPVVRAAAIGGLGRHWASISQPVFESALKDRNQYVRSYALFAIMSVSDEAALEPALTAVKDRSFDVRKSAAYILGRFKDKRAIAALLRCLHDRDPEVRMNAADGLGNIGDLSCVPGLTKLMRDNNSTVRNLSMKAIEKIISRE